MTQTGPNRTSGRWARAVQFPLSRIVLGLAMVVVPVVAAQWLAHALALARPYSVLVSALGACVAAYGGYRAFVRLVEGRRAVAELGAAGAWKEAGAGFVLGTLLFSATIGVLLLLDVFHVTGGAVGAWSGLVVPLALSLTAGVLEELMFRGVVFRITEAWLGTWWALAISAVLFGLVHLVGPHATLLGAVSIIFEAGILLGAAFVLTRRLWLPIGIHVAWNFTQGGIFGVAVSGTPSNGLLRGTLAGPDWLSGGSFGAEASIVAVALCMALAMFLLGAAVQRDRLVPAPWRRAAQAAAGTGGA
ncbi:MAG TPA: CPBP family intramembrane glutamic endopeptidase [Albitalea sp.]|nr:CPBP family intramembrane glutamic endopeptidase [Albitalea sp.]